MNKPPKVLVVDDEEINQDVLAGILRPHYTVLLSRNGEQALKCAAHPKGRPDLILLDINMPEVDGYEVCRRLKMDKKTRDIPVIFVSALNNDASETKGLELGAADYIVKPVRASIVLARVRTHLALSLAHNTEKEQNKQLREAAQQLKEAERQRAETKRREEISRIMRHDLKGPLSAIIAVPDLLEEVGTLNEPQKALMQTVKESGYRLLDMINRSLDIYKMELGAYILHATVVDLWEVLQKVSSELQGLSSSKGVTLLTQINHQQSEGKGSFFIVGEELLCHSMFSNLVKNAIESTHENSDILISLESTQECICAKIHNKGRVPESIRESFFEKYTTYGKTNGTGLGTYSARLITELHGGRIGLDTETDPEGTILTVRLRIADEA